VPAGWAPHLIDDDQVQLQDSGLYLRTRKTALPPGSGLDKQFKEH
jgi:hypothetical protein